MMQKIYWGQINLMTKQNLVIITGKTRLMTRGYTGHRDEKFPSGKIL
jgi:hypothetical protein